MASGRTHDIINLIALPPLVYYLSPSDFPFFAGGYLAGTFLLTPDVDTYHSTPVKRWKFLKFIWKPYTKFSKHRGISHLPFYGSLIRLFYLIFLFYLLYLGVIFSLNYMGINIPVVNINENNLKSLLLNNHVISFLAGLFMAEIMHILVDIIYSSLKKVKLIRWNLILYRFFVFLEYRLT